MVNYSATAEQHEVLSDEHKTFFLENEVHATQHNINTIETARDNLYTYLAERSQLSISDPYFYELKDNQLWGKGCNLPMVEIVKIPLYSTETKFIERTKAEVAAIEKIEKFAVEAPEGAAFIEISPTSPEYPGYIASMIRIGIKYGNSLRCSAITIPEKTAEDSLKNMNLFRKFFPPVDTNDLSAEDLIANPLFFTTVENKHIQSLLRDNSGKFIENNFYILSGEILNALKQDSIETITEKDRIQIVQNAQATIEHGGKPKLLVVGDEKQLFHKTKELLDTKGIFGDPEKSLIDHYLESLRYPLTEFSSQDYLFMVLNIQDILREQYNNGIKVDDLDSIFEKLDLRSLTYTPEGGGGNEVGGVSVNSIDPGILSDLKKKALENEERHKIEENQYVESLRHEKGYLYEHEQQSAPLVINPLISILTIPQLTFFTTENVQLSGFETKIQNENTGRVSGEISQKLKIVNFFNATLLAQPKPSLGNEEKEVIFIPLIEEPDYKPLPYKSLQIPVATQVDGNIEKSLFIQSVTTSLENITVFQGESVQSNNQTVFPERAGEVVNGTEITIDQVKLSVKNRDTDTTSTVQNSVFQQDIESSGQTAESIEARYEQQNIYQTVKQTHIEAVVREMKEYTKDSVKSTEASSQIEHTEKSKLDTNIKAMSIESTIAELRAEQQLANAVSQEISVEEISVPESQKKQEISNTTSQIIETKGIPAEEHNAKQQNTEYSTSESIRTIQNEVLKTTVVKSKKLAKGNKRNLRQAQTYSQKDIKSASMDGGREELPASRFQTIKPRVVKIGMNRTNKAETINIPLKKNSEKSERLTKIISQAVKNEQGTLAFTQNPQTATRGIQNSSTSSFLNPRIMHSRHKQVMHAHVEEEDEIKKLFEKLKSQGELVVTSEQASGLARIGGITIENRWHNTDYALIRLDSFSAK